MLLHITLAIVAGAAIALQAGINTALGQRLGSPLYATVVAFGAGLCFAALAALLRARVAAGPAWRGVPTHLWFVGGLLGVFALASFYWLIPRLGIGTTLSLTLTGQLLVALAAGHLGWFGLPPAPLSTLRLIGAGTLLLGILLVTKG
ncbi:MAG: DMT family transporter [Planctomycetes bacterium]|nr:DMT family transporter [Planctomycetota bacterium]